jgi:hypothetical protein
MSQENVKIVRALQPPPAMDLVRLFGDETTAAAVMEAPASRFQDDLEVVATGGGAAAPV